MARTINITMYCAKGKGRYTAYFEETEHNVWSCVRTEKVAKPPIFKSMLLSKRKQETASERQNRADFKGTFYIGEHVCPYCGSKNFVQCSACGEMSCWDDSKKTFTCGNCGASGEVSGTIESVNADGGAPETKPNSRRLM